MNNPKIGGGFEKNQIFKISYLESRNIDPRWHKIKKK